VVNFEHLHVVLRPSHFDPEFFVHLENLSKAVSTPAHNNEGCGVIVLLTIVVMFCVHFVHFKDALHLSNVQVEGSYIIEDVKLYQGELEVNLEVFGLLKVVDFFKSFVC